MSSEVHPLAVEDESYFRNYASERAGKRGPPSERYARTHPYPTYSQFGKPQFIDMQNRGYKIGDGLDAKHFYETSTSDALWSPSDEFAYAELGEHLLYMRIKKGQLRRETLGFPKSREELTLLHLKSRRLYDCVVMSVTGHDYGRSNTGSVKVRFIDYLGRVERSYFEKHVTEK